MKKLFVLGLLAFALWFGLRMGMQRQLVGKWQCNGKLTVETLAPLLKGQPKHVAQMMETGMSGMTATVTNDRMTTSFAGYGPMPSMNESVGYSIADSSLNTLTLQPEGPGLKDKNPTKIHFVSPTRFWLGGEDLKGANTKMRGMDISEFRVYFDRVN